MGEGHSPGNEHENVSHSVLSLSATPWPAVCQAPGPWNSPGKSPGVGAIPSPVDLPNPGIKPRCLALQADSLPSEPPRKPITQAEETANTWCWGLKHAKIIPGTARKPIRLQLESERSTAL